MRFLVGLGLLAALGIGVWFNTDPGQAWVHGPVCQRAAWAAICHGGWPAVPAAAVKR